MQSDCHSEQSVLCAVRTRPERSRLPCVCLRSPNPVIPTGANHRESGDLRSGGTCCCADHWTDLFQISRRTTCLSIHNSELPSVSPWSQCRNLNQHAALKPQIPLP